ncbi:MULTISPECIES: ABC transporter ATP-binding protein [Roseobacteraceae]|uniref:Putative siderophore transport system ATP-binding protein YusV n=1 Tax=Pseudosulfitobacter pseudonitzschiae TaxID=1402135 RepID=A0A221K859_9RHOB|nr:MULTISPECIES: ATP-binding cassette domain-containing protein [Roseobacteraceae]ASM75191.1 putative siderophore transport system ATP-binding protein YusV [Pseudosulfitobacter pseudonitzschiae]
MIVITDLNHDRDGVATLWNINLSIDRGGVTALIGPNGAGKSTLLSLMSRLLPIQRGKIMVDDLQIGRCPNDVLARKLAILPQSNDTAPLLTVRELVSFGRYPYHKGRPDQRDREKVEEAILALGLLPLAERRLGSLSGGQRQRAQVAMTFAQDTDYVLLDEPLNNLDISASRALMAVLQDLALRHDRAIVIVLHDINYAAAYADRIVAMKDGRVVAMGAPGEVLTESILWDVFETNPKVHRIGTKVMVEV